MIFITKFYIICFITQITYYIYNNQLFMQISTLDWIIIFSFFALFILIGIYYSKRSGQSSKEFFLSGRDMPWWLLGISMVATTFSACLLVRVLFQKHLKMHLDEYVGHNF